MSSKHIFSVLSKERTAAGSRSSISCYLVYFLLLSFEDEKILLGNVRALAFIQGRRLFKYMRHDPSAPLALVTETEEVCCVTATGKTGKKYISRAGGAEQVHVLGLAHCALITSRASSFIFGVFDPSASEPISYQPIWRQSN